MMVERCGPVVRDVWGEIRPASELFYKIADRVLCLKALDDRAARLADEFISGLHFTPITPAIRSREDCLIRIRAESALPCVPEGLQSFAVERGRCHLNGGSHYLEIDESTVLVGAGSSAVVDVWIGQTPHARHPVAIANTISYAVQAALRRCNLYLLHAAGVVRPEDGACALIIGGSGSGKSTLTLRLASNGWRYLSDDILVLFEESNKILASGYRRPFALSESVLSAFDLERLDEALGPAPLTDPCKRFLEPGILFPGSFAASAVPRHLFFASVTNQSKSLVSRLSRSEAMARLIQLCPWSCCDVSISRDYLDVLSSLVKQCDAQVLSAGLDILEDPELAAMLLASQMS
ncbi:MAG TPA: hypothetical protein VD966_03700 [Pyrinomonadaceae bacterium]|nr:hypothetical protein [Pyrinomonadaceae bacterium]